MVTPDIIQHLGGVGPMEVRTLTWELKNTSGKPISFRVLDTAPGVRVLKAPFEPWQPVKPGNRSFLGCLGFSGLPAPRRALEPDDPPSRATSCAGT